MCRIFLGVQVSQCKKGFKYIGFANAAITNSDDFRDISSLGVFFEIGVVVFEMGKGIFFLCEFRGKVNAVGVLKV